MMRGGGWCQTYTGQRVYPLDPRPNEIFIQDIAGSLSKMCRFAGHCIRFYSVAEHCVLAASKAPADLQLTMLLHDASEAYLVDIPRPIKPHLGSYYTYENVLMEVISNKFGTIWPLPAEVKRIDTAMMGTERQQNMAWRPEPPEEWGDTEPPLDVTLQFWSPDEAYQMFMNAFDALTKGVEAQ